MQVLPPSVSGRQAALKQVPVHVWPTVAIAVQTRQAVPLPSQLNPAAQSSVAVQGVPARPTPVTSKAQAAGPEPRPKLSCAPEMPRPRVQVALPVAFTQAAPCVGS